MRALDTTVLLDVLRGAEGVAEAVQAGQLTELVATELAFGELSTLARLDRSPGRDRRLAALEKLRRHVSFLPLDESAARTVALVRQRMPEAPSWFVLQLAILEARNVSEWVVELPRGRVPKGSTKISLVDYRRKKPKNT